MQMRSNQQQQACRESAQEQPRCTRTSSHAMCVSGVSFECAHTHSQTICTPFHIWSGHVQWVDNTQAVPSEKWLTVFPARSIENGRHMCAAFITSGSIAAQSTRHDRFKRHPVGTALVQCRESADLLSLNIERSNIPGPRTDLQAREHVDKL